MKRFFSNTIENFLCLKFNFFFQIFSVFPTPENNQNKNLTENLLEINQQHQPNTLSPPISFLSTSSSKIPKNSSPTSSTTTTTNSSSSPSFVNELEEILHFGSQQVGNFEENNEEGWATIERPRAHSDFGFGKNGNSKKLTQRRPWKR